MGKQQSMSCSDPIRFHSSKWVKKAAIAWICWGLLMGNGGGGGWASRAVDHCRTSAKSMKSVFVCLSFTSNSSLKPVRGSRSPLIRKQHSVCSAPLSAVVWRAHCVSWLRTPRDCVDLPYLKCIIFIPPLLFCMADCLLSGNPLNPSARRCRRFVVWSADFLDKQHGETCFFCKNTGHIIALIWCLFVRVCWPACMCGRSTQTLHVCNKGCIVFKDKAVFQRSFPAAPPELSTRTLSI